MLALEEGAVIRPIEKPLPRYRLVDSVELGYLLSAYGRSLPVDGATHAPLREMLADVLAHPGSLIRAQLAYRLFRGSPVGAPAARDIAIAIEYFHTASLVLDDMPMMDDSRQRRGRPCSHLSFGEGTAMLGALALINRAYALAWGVIGDLPRPRRERASNLLDELLGVRGLLDGQSKDLAFAAEEPSTTSITAVAERKTVPLIRMSLVLPAVICGLEEHTIDRLDRLAVAWGFAYQLIDDVKDCLESESAVGKSTRRDRTLGRPNLCNHLGGTGAIARLGELIEEAGELVAETERAEWHHLGTLHEVLEFEARRLARKIGARRQIAPLPTPHERQPRPCRIAS